MTKRTILLFILALYGAAACTPKPPDIKIASAEAKLSPALIGVAAIFMKIENAGGSDDQLEKARVDMDGVITELHDIQDGKMVKINNISIPAGSTVTLRPASKHIMVLNLPKHAQEGFTLSLVLTFKKSGDKILPLRLAPFAKFK